MVRREILGVCHGQSTVIGRVLRIGMTANSVCLAAYHWQMDFSAYWTWLAVLRHCFSSGTAADGRTPYKARPSQNWPKITTYDHVHQIFITSFITWFRRGVLHSFAPLREEQRCHICHVVQANIVCFHGERVHEDSSGIVGLSMPSATELSNVIKSLTISFKPSSCTAVRRCSLACIEISWTRASHDLGPVVLRWDSCAACSTYAWKRSLSRVSLTACRQNKAFAYFLSDKTPDEQQLVLRYHYYTCPTALLNAGFEAGMSETHNRQQTECPLTNQLKYQGSTWKLSSPCISKQKLSTHQSHGSGMSDCFLTWQCSTIRE